MSKEELLSEFREFLEEMGNRYPLPHSGGTIAGLSERVNYFNSIFDELNDLIIEKVNELLQKVNEEDGKELKELLLSESILFQRNHLGVSPL